MRVCTALASFPFAPRPLFRLLNKLDLAFCSLLREHNAETGEQLSGFAGGRGRMSTTEKVRLRGLVEKMRVSVVESSGKNMNSVAETSSDTQEEDFNVSTEDDEHDGSFSDDGDDDPTGMQIDGNHGRWEMEIARVYERAIEELGLSLDAAIEATSA